MIPILRQYEVAIRPESRAESAIRSESRAEPAARRARRVAVVVGALVALASIPFWATAQLSQTTDPNDVKGLMDVRKIKVSGSNKPRFLTTTFHRWRAKRVWDAGYTLVYLDAKGDDWFEFYALIYSDGRSMKGRLYRHRRQKSDYVVRKLSAWKPNKKKVVVKIPLKHLNMPEKRTVVRWYVQTLMTGRDCPSVCIDRAPDKGALDFLLPLPTPTPTVSPSPTVTASPSPTATASPSPTAEPSPSASPSSSP